MNRSIGRLVLATAALAGVLAVSAPVLADGGHGHGGGSGSGRGGSFAGNRGNSGAGHGNYSAGRGSFATDRGGGAGRNLGGGGRPSGAGHYITGGGREFGAGRNFTGGREFGAGRNFTGGREPGAGARVITGGQMFAAPRFNPPARMGGNYSVPGRSMPGRVYGGVPGRYVPGNSSRYVPGNSTGHFSSSPRFDRPPASFTSGSQRNFGRPGLVHTSPHHGGFNRPYWNGGYWHGRFWPRAYYRPGFIGFIPLLPAFYSTFWFGGVSYYYANDLYYTWSPDRYGYVVTAPPPAAESAPAGEAESGGSASVYVYPRNGQSEEQVANDRYECHQWAVGQTGFDPTRGMDQSESASSSDDYRRAMIACLDARGYSAN
jgi:hypothetical protein